MKLHLDFIQWGLSVGPLSGGPQWVALSGASQWGLSVGPLSGATGPRTHPFKYSSLLNSGGRGPTGPRTQPLKYSSLLNPVGAGRWGRTGL